MKKALVFLVMLPRASYASGFGDEDATKYVLILFACLVLVAWLILGSAGGLVFAIFRQKN